MRPEPGRVVIYRDVQGGKTLWEAPHVVVEDGPERVALYIAPGTQGLCPEDRLAADYADRLSSGKWELSPFTWHTHHVLRLISWDAAHSVECYWSEETWEFRGWYVNLQAPLRRVADGFETTDHTLDVVISPDGEWNWKDEAQLADLVRIGHYSDEAAQRFRAEALRAIDCLESRQGVFAEGWEDWRPTDAAVRE